ARWMTCAISLSIHSIQKRASSPVSGGIKGSHFRRVRLAPLVAKSSSADTSSPRRSCGPRYESQANPALAQAAPSRAFYLSRTIGEGHQLGNRVAGLLGRAAHRSLWTRYARLSGAARIPLIAAMKRDPH